MISICIVNVKHAYLSAVYGISDILEYANGAFGEVFHIEIASPANFMESAATFDLVIIPPFRMNETSELDLHLVKVLKNANKRGVTLASVCAGAFYLCATGLAEGTAVTTHWNLADALQKMYPRILVRRERILIDNGEMISAGGITSFQDFSLYLIKKYISVEAALETAKIFLINPESRSQQQYAVLSLMQPDENSVLGRAQRYIQEHFHEPVALAEIADYCSISVRTLLRHFSRYCEFTPGEYLRNLRLDKAKQLLAVTDMPLKSIYCIVGYSDGVAFSKAFRKEIGITPGDYRKRNSQI